MYHIRMAQACTLILVCTFLIPLTMAADLCFAGEDYRQRYHQDIETILTARLGMKSTIAFVDGHPEIFAALKVDPGQHPLNREQRMIVWQSWQNFLDHVLFFDTMGQMYAETYKEIKGTEKKKDTFLPAFACFLAQYRFAMDYIDRMEKNPSMHVILNQAVPELGLEEGGYAKVKYRFLNVLRGAEFARLNILYRYYKEPGKDDLQAAMEEDVAEIWAAGKGKGPSLTAQNALKIVGSLGFTAWFPVQKNISSLMGQIKVWRPGVSLISSEQIEKLKAILRPGDILLQRREWYATNVGIPGFWTHAALYIGTPEERTHYFAGSNLKKWFAEQGSTDGTLDSLLQSRYPEHYLLSITDQEEQHQPSVLEAIAKGVSFTTLEHSASADSIAILRPNLPAKSRAQAILRAFHYGGRPYDFNFDFRTDSELVCSELIYKAYEGTLESEGLSLPLSIVLDRPLFSPNEIARIFDAEYQSEHRQFTLVAFLDGNEKEHKAIESDVKGFRDSWKRPKWHIWVQEAETTQ